MKKESTSYKFKLRVKELNLEVYGKSVKWVTVAFVFTLAIINHLNDIIQFFINLNLF